MPACSSLTASIAAPPLAAHSIGTPIVRRPGEIATVTTADRRSDRRHRADFRVVAVRAGASETVGILRDVSVLGAMVEILAVLKRGDRVTVRFSDRFEAEAQVIWYRDGKCGLRLDRPAGVETLLGIDRLRPDIAERAPRVAAGGAASIRCNDRSHPAELIDLSQRGARLRTPLVMDANAKIVVELPGLGPIPATVRWQRKGEIGCLFQGAFPLRYFMRVLEQINARSAAAGRS